MQNAGSRIALLRPDLWVGVFAVALIVGHAAMFHFSKAPTPLAHIRGLDPPRYFGTAHSLLFDRDFDLTNEFAVLDPKRPEPGMGGFEGIHGQPGSPYAIGYSLLSLPFLAAGTAVDALCGRAPNGYGQAAVFSFLLANIVFTIIGLWLLSKFLQEMGLSAPAAAGISLSLWFATSVGFYSLLPMSHASTFMMSSAFLLIWWKIRERDDIKAYVGLGACGGLLAMCRWQDALFLAGPFLAEAFQGKNVFKNYRKWACYGAAAVVVFIPQMIQWKVLYGGFITMPQGSGFVQLPPHFIPDVLFSTNHGWFVWTPVTFLGVAGLLFGACCHARYLWAWVIVLALEVSVIGSMPQNWFCGDSFGIRSLNSCIPLTGLGIGILILHSRMIARRALAAAVTACMIFTTLFALQTSLYMIPRVGDLTVHQILWGKLRVIEVIRHKV